MHPHTLPERASLLVAAFLLPGLAWAAPPAPATAVPGGTIGGQAPATSGKTELDGTGKFASAAVLDAAATDATEFDIAAGGLLSTGNARAGSVTGSSRLRLRRGSHQFSAAFAGNYGRAAVDPQSAPVPTVGNVQGRVRYDYFLHQRASLFAMATARHDKFQGLDARLNFDPGVAIYFLTDPKNRLWTEVGYDFQYDRFTLEATYAKNEDGTVMLDGNGDPVIAIDRSRNNHAVRAFGGYANSISPALTFSTGVEYLQSVQVARRWRLNWDTALTATLINKLAVSLTFTARLDNDPAPGIRKVDTITAVSLLYRFF